MTPRETIADPAHLLRLRGHLADAADDERLVDIAYRSIDTPVGNLLLAASPKGLVRVAYANEGHDRVLEDLSNRISPRLLHQPSRFDGIARELDEYFGGRRRAFSGALDWRLSAGFRQTVLRRVSDIAYGRTASYATIAELVGRPSAVRSAGTACATNPMPVVVPCHRVVRSDGTMGGYLGGPGVKAALLELEASA